MKQKPHLCRYSGLWVVKPFRKSEGFLIIYNVKRTLPQVIHNLQFRHSIGVMPYFKRKTA